MDEIFGRDGWDEEESGFVRARNHPSVAAAAGKEAWWKVDGRLADLSLRPPEWKLLRDGPATRMLFLMNGGLFANKEDKVYFWGDLECKAGHVLE